jgi:hypothetical protein
MEPKTEASFTAPGTAADLMSQAAVSASPTGKPDTMVKSLKSIKTDSKNQRNALLF